MNLVGDDLSEAQLLANEQDGQARKVFVGGLPHNLAVEDFRKYFAQFGDLEDCVIL